MGGSGVWRDPISNHKRREINTVNKGKRLVSNPSAKQTHVLLALHDSDQLNAYRECLTSDGFDVTTAETPLACLSELECRRPDVLVLERELPGGGGNSVETVLDQEPQMRGIPVILLVNGAVLAKGVRFDLPFARQQLAVSAVAHDLETQVRWTEETWAPNGNAASCVPVAAG